MGRKMLFFYFYRRTNEVVMAARWSQSSRRPYFCSSHFPDKVKKAEHSVEKGKNRRMIGFQRVDILGDGFCGCRAEGLLVQQRENEMFDCWSCGFQVDAEQLGDIDSDILHIHAVTHEF